MRGRLDKPAKVQSDGPHKYPTYGMSNAGKALFDFAPLARQYDRWYQKPAGRTHDRVQKEDVKCLLRPARAGQRLQDVGCGTGHWSAFFAGMGYQVTGIDVAPDMIEVARTAVPECSFLVGDACDLPFKTALFDVAASMATLEFIPDPDSAVREMARCTKPGGSLLIGTLNRLAPLNQRRLSEGKQPYASAHLFSPQQLRSLLAPWGRVRMIASTPRRRRRKRRALRPRRIAARKPLRRGRLCGPFIVAEVRL